MEGDVPNHSTFSRNRHGRSRESDILRHLFEDVVRRRIDENLVGSEGFAVDASLIQADANTQRSLPGKEWNVADLPAKPRQAVRDYLETLADAAFGASSSVTPKLVSPSDPTAQWTDRQASHRWSHTTLPGARERLWSLSHQAGVVRKNVHERQFFSASAFSIDTYLGGAQRARSIVEDRQYAGPIGQRCDPFGYKVRLGSAAAIAERS